MPQPRTWQGVWGKQAERLLAQTGDDVPTWNARVLAEAPGDETGVRAWLDERGVRGYPQAMLIMERFGYPDFLVDDDQELIDAQFADREDLRPILDHLLARVRSQHPDLEVVGRKTYVPLYTPRRQFAAVKPTTRTRVDLGLRLDGREPSGRLVVAHGVGSDSINLRLPLATVDDIDDEVVQLMDEAWQDNI